MSTIEKRAAARRIFLQLLSSALIVWTTQMLVPRTAHAQTPAAGSTPASGATTADVMAATVGALPSCLKYQVTGVCFFLKCYVFYCEVETSIRVSHYVPDVVVSSYNDPLQHPWTDIGRAIAKSLSSAGSSMMKMPLDSSATTARESREVVTFKSTDAIGNPVGAIMGDSSSFEFPDFNELMNFPSQELPKIQQQWAMVPVDLGNGVLEGARSQAMNPSALLSGITSLPGQFGGRLGNMTGLGSMGVSNPLSGSMSGGASGGAGGGGSTGGSTSSTGGTTTGSTSTSTTATGTTSTGSSSDSSSGGSSSGGQSAGGAPPSYSASLDAMYQALQNAGASGSSSSSGSGSNSGGSGGMSSYICPGGSGMFSLHYQADIDSIFWRGKLPLELLYPGSWVPGIGEVGNSLINTWGGTYPRTGELVQSHPVKSSAVLAARVGSIIRQSAQPHIYKKLSVKAEGSYVYFARVADPRWQAVYPVAGKDCITFGTNDSLSLGSYGDYGTSGSEGYIWNLWNRYECCERKTPIFLFAVP